MMDTISLMIELEVLKEKINNAEAFLKELIYYIFVVCKEDDYITPEGICRKLYKYGFIDKKDGEWVVDTPYTKLPKQIRTPYEGDIKVAPQTKKGYMWTCPKCGTENHSDFKKCPCCGYTSQTDRIYDNCGTPRDKCVYCIEEDRMWTPQTDCD